MSPFDWGVVNYLPTPRGAIWVIIKTACTYALNDAYIFISMPILNILPV